MLLHSQPHILQAASKRSRRQDSICKAAATNNGDKCSRYKKQQRQQGQRPSPAAAAASSPKQLLSEWLQRAAAVAAAAAVTTSAVLLPPTVLPAAAHMGTMDHAVAQHAAAASNLASNRFRCTPLTDHQRADSFDLAGFHRRIATSSPLAQKLFDQGLLLAYDFNHPEALKSFQAGLRHDPNAAMLHWGVVYTSTPYANAVWGPAPADDSFPVISQEELARAQQAAKDALRTAQAAAAAKPGDPLLQTELQYAAAAYNYVTPLKDNGDPKFEQQLEQYAQALESLAGSHPGDADAAALAAEARMNLSPWLHWEGPLEHRTAVQADRVVLPALKDIRTALDRVPGHPLAVHMTIHLTEAGTPGAAGDVPAEPGYAAMGLAAAEYLFQGGPSSSPAYPQMGHLTHMPGHTFIRTGRWHDAVTANQIALAADEAQTQKCIMPYMPEHNAALLQFAAANTGEFATAEALARKQVRFPEIFGPTNMSDGRERATLPLLYARFAKWDEIMQLPATHLDYSNDGIMIPKGTAEFNKGVWHYTRALALAAAAEKETDSARRADVMQHLSNELSGLQSAVAATPEDPLTRPGDGIGIVSTGFKRLGQIQLQVAQARIDELHHNHAAAAAKLQQAIAIDNTFGYTEPPRQIQPLKPCVGWVMMQQGQLKQAEQAYLDDLAMFPLNPWSLKGLQQVYSRQEQTPQVAAKLEKVSAALAAAWSHADKDIHINSSCPAFSD